MTNNPACPALHTHPPRKPHLGGAKCARVDLAVQCKYSRDVIRVLHKAIDHASSSHMIRWLVVLIILRLLLAVVLPDLWKTLDLFVELSTPISSFLRLKEGVYMLNNLGISPYSGGPCHHSPLLVSLFSIIPEQFSGALFHAIDIYASLQLAAFASELGPAKAIKPSVVVAFYLFNPFSLLSTFAQSTNQISNALICCSLGASSKRRGGLAICMLGLATVLSFYPAYLIVSLLGIIQSFQPTVSKIKYLALFIASVVGFLALAYLPFASWDFLESQYGTLLFNTDLTRPNIGLWWYFFIELFEFFRPFFLGAFQLFLVSFPISLNLRFPKQPLFTLGCLVGIMAVFKPYPEASDLGLYLTLLIVNKPVFELLEYRTIEMLGLFYVSVLARAFHYLWIYVGSGNANFYFAITLVYAVVMVILFADSTWSAVRIDYDGGKAKNLTQL